jgi:hypothetical protein
MTITYAAGRAAPSRIVAVRCAMQNPAFVRAPFWIGERVPSVLQVTAAPAAFTKIFAVPCELPLLT